MKPEACPRKWEVEAIRDGRLSGKDLDSAVRHRGTCPECADEERQLAALGREIWNLPESAPDAVGARRARQQLLAAMNGSVLQAPKPRALRRAAWGLALGVAALVSAWLTRKHPALNSAESPIVEVRAAPAARWVEHREQGTYRVELLDGEASFDIRRHDGPRVVIALPDGEVEDVGTVLQIRVRDHRTELISVQEGRVSVRLRGRPDFALAAGQAWGSHPEPKAELQLDAGPRADDSSQRSAEPGELPSLARADTELGAAASPSGAAIVSKRLAELGARPSRSAPGPMAPQKPPNAPVDAQAARAEDEAYLQIVELLRQAKYPEARAEAKDYLLRFPNGFRRVEVLNVATHTSSDPSAVQP